MTTTTPVRRRTRLCGGWRNRTRRGRAHPGVPDGFTRGDNDNDMPLRAIWRMVWTLACDVVSLRVSPFACE